MRKSQVTKLYEEQATARFSRDQFAWALEFVKGEKKRARDYFGLSWSNMSQQERLEYLSGRLFFAVVSQAEVGRHPILSDNILALRAALIALCD